MEFRVASWQRAGVTMTAERQSIGEQFAELVSRLDALIDFHRDDPSAAADLDRLKIAREKAARGATLARQLPLPWSGAAND